MKLIGLYGPKRSGKDTAANGLLVQGWDRVTLADPLRESLYTLDPLLEPGLSLRHLVDACGWEGAKSSPYTAEVRRLMVAQGDAMRALRPAIFIEVALERIALAAAAGAPGVVITDVRFENEALAVIQAGGRIVRVERPGVDFDQAHASETPLREELVFSSVRNDSTPAELHRQMEFVSDLVAS